MPTKSNGHAAEPHPHARGRREKPRRSPTKSPTMAALSEGLPPKAPAPQLHRSAFPPIADYAFLSDCEVNALVAPNGNIEWLCVPRHDAPSVFSAMLDRDAGGFRVGAVGIAVPARRAYIPGSLVLET